MKLIRNSILLAVLVWALFTTTSETVVEESVHQKIAKVLADGLPKAHLSQHKLDDPIASQALENYLSSLDFDHSYFMDGDIAQFEVFATELDNQLKEGDTRFAVQVMDLFKERASNRVEFVKSILTNDFDFSIAETYALKRKELPWSKNEEEWDQLWRKKIKHELLTHKINQLLEVEEAQSQDSEKASTEILANTTNEVVQIKKVLAPKELILKRYEQFLSVLNGHDAEWTMQLYLNAFATAYDSHSSYLSPRTTEDFDISMKLSLTGIGALLTLEDGAAKVVRLIAGGPAESDGRLKPGDKIIAVAQEDDKPIDILYWPLYKSVRLIRGKIGTKVVLNVIEASDVTGGLIKKIDLIRDVIKLEERSAKLEVREVPEEHGSEDLKLGILTLPDFYADIRNRKEESEQAKSSARDVKDILLRIKDESVDGLLIDLRNNGGGSLSDAVEMTGYFIDKGPVVQVKANRRVQVLYDPHPDILYKGPLVILVNRQSASASEILASALQDYGRAIIVGDSKTHGKGSVQTLFPLDKRDAQMGTLKVTTAGFYRIDGRTTQLIGVTPDIVIPSVLDIMEIGEEFLPNVLSLSEIESSKYVAYADVSSIIAMLQKRSEDRINQSEKFNSYTALLKHMKQKLDLKEISLLESNRLSMARHDKSLEVLETKLLEDSEVYSDNEEEQKDKDIILIEALEILKDLIDVRDLVKN